jgi:short-subunit dehydrogenase
MTPPLVFITGASSGIGQALAERYALEGWRLALVARRAEAMQAWAQAQGLGPDRCGIYPADVADIDSVVAAAQACLAAQGLPQVVIANAGISVGVDTAYREDLDAMARTFATNNVGLAATFHPFIDPMRRRGSGTLVGIASVAGIRGLAGHGAYCASKAAVISYCESLRAELRGTGVKVVTISPGYVATPLTARNPYPMPFLMQPADFAAKAVRAIGAGVRHRTIPWPMGVVAAILRVLPGAWLERALAGQPRKRRQDAG